MARFLLVLLLVAATAFAAQVPNPGDVTFNGDVLPILQRDCQSCHRPGQAAPMSLMTYQNARPWAKAMKSAVLGGKMPPWFADPRYGEFRNAPQLTAADKKILAAWADAGAPEGNPANAPKTAQWTEGWRIQPDVVVGMPVPHTVHARGEGEIQSFLVPNPFREDTWVTSIEIRPGDASVVHHVIVQVPEEDAVQGSSWGTSCACTPTFAPGVERILPKRADKPARQQGGWGNDQPEASEPEFASMEAVYVPGAPPLDFRFRESAKLIPGKRPIRIEVHYTPNGKETQDQTRVGFTLAKGTPKRVFVAMAPTSLMEKRSFAIPAGAQNFESRGELTFLQNAELVWFMPHMHLRGKDMAFDLRYPNGIIERVLSARFNFNWQMGYEVESPIRVSKGTRMIVTAHHDNSANNPFNPNPGESVRWGELTSQEMMLPWFGVVVNQDARPAQIAAYKPRTLTVTPSSDFPKLPAGIKAPAIPGIPSGVPGLRLPANPLIVN